MADYSNNVNGLAQLLSIAQQGSQHAAQLRQQRQMPGIQEQSDEKLMQATSAQKEQAAKSRLQDVLGVVDSGKLPEGAGISVGPEGASVTRQPNLGVYDLKKQQFDEKQANLYSKGLEKYSDLSGAAQDIERITNRDGQGGIFTNPNAKLVSGGKVVSAIPDAAMGIAEMTGAVPQGTAEERKALARYKLSMGHALTGARMNPTMQKAIQDSLGGMASGDPDLMAKGLRGSGRIIGGTIKTVQGGFTPEVRGQVHSQGNGDPMDLFGRIPSENGPPSNYQSPPALSGRQHKGMSSSAPQQPAQESGFNPDSYLKGN